MLTRALTLGVAALLLGACAHVAQDDSGALSKAEPAGTGTGVSKELFLIPLVDIHAQIPPPAPTVEAPSPAPPPPPNVWDRIRAGFRMANLDGALVLQQEQWY